MSIPKPKHQPLMAAMTGFEHFSMEVMAAWKSSMCRRSSWAVRAVSSFDVRWGFRLELEDEKAWTSRPAVKALEPAPERIMARVEGDVERWEKRGESSVQTLLDRSVLAGICTKVALSAKYLLVCKGIQLLGAIYLNMGNIGERVGEVEVFARWKAVLFCHCVKRLCLIAGLISD